MPLIKSKILFNEVRFSLTDWYIHRNELGLMLFGDMDIFMSNHILGVNKDEVIRMINMYKDESGDKIDIRGVKNPKTTRGRAKVMNISDYYKNKYK